MGRTTKLSDLPMKTKRKNSKRPTKRKRTAGSLQRVVRARDDNAMRILHDSLKKRAAWWHNTSEDPYGIAQAVYVALVEAASAVNDAMALAGQRPNAELSHADGRGDAPNSK